MAKIQEEIYILQVSKLIKGDVEDAAKIADVNFSDNIASVAQELLGPGVMVEVIDSRG